MQRAKVPVYKRILECALVKVQRLPIGCYSNLFLHRQNRSRKLHAPYEATKLVTDSTRQNYPITASRFVRVSSPVLSRLVDVNLGGYQTTQSTTDTNSQTKRVEKWQNRLSDALSKITIRRYTIWVLCISRFSKRWDFEVTIINNCQ